MLQYLMRDNGKREHTDIFMNVTEGLQSCYRDKMLPCEKSTLFHQCYAPPLTDGDFAAKPMVLLMGQYSTGKSTFIRHLLERDYPGLRIGPEPTTDKFVCVMHGKQDKIIPGNALVVDKSMPFTQLSNYGNNFLQRLECVTLNSPVLEGLTLVDTPGVLSGEKQRLQRGYDFEAVIKWFADRSDMVILLFDAHKLDISDEFKRCIHALKGNDTKIRIVLNKADRVSTQQLMRVYGALMWALGKVVQTPEVARVFLGSFWDQPLHNDEQRRLFEQEENDLYTAISLLPRNAATRQLNDLIKRARLARVHAYLMDYFKSEMPSVFGKSAKQKQMIKDLGQICQDLAKKHNLPLGDFPNVAALQKKLTEMDFAKDLQFSQKDLAKRMRHLEKLLDTDVQKLLKLIPAEERENPDRYGQASFLSRGGGAGHMADPSPFAVTKEGGLTEQSYLQQEYLTNKPDSAKYREEFLAVGPDPRDNKISGLQAKNVLEKSKLNNSILHRVWQLADIDKDGRLSLFEFTLAKHFMEMKLKGLELPAQTPPHFMDMRDEEAERKKIVEGLCGGGKDGYNPASRTDGGGSGSSGQAAGEGSDNPLA